jgi:hypothetical protein
VTQTNPYLPVLTIDEITAIRRAKSIPPDTIARAAVLRATVKSALFDLHGFQIVPNGVVMASVVVGFSLLGVSLANSNLSPGGYWLVLLFMISLVASAPVLRWFHRDRRARKRSLPMLARGFRPLNATEKEITEQLAWARITGSEMGRAINPKDAYNMMNAIEDTSLRNAVLLDVENWGRQIIKDHQIGQAFDEAIEIDQLHSSDSQSRPENDNT